MFSRKVGYTMRYTGSGDRTTHLSSMRKIGTRGGSRTERRYSNVCVLAALQPTRRANWNKRNRATSYSLQPVSIPELWRILWSQISLCIASCSLEFPCGSSSKDSSFLSSLAIFGQFISLASIADSTTAHRNQPAATIQPRCGNK